jgi:hypothetical protein
MLLNIISISPFIKSSYVNISLNPQTHSIINHSYLIRHEKVPKVPQFQAKLGFSIGQVGVISDFQLGVED